MAHCGERRCLCTTGDSALARATETDTIGCGIHFMKTPPRLRSALAILLSLCAILLVAASDYLAADAGFAFFYLVPVLFAAWFVSRRAGFVVSFVAVIAELATDVLSGYSTPGTPTPYVNAVLRFALFFLITWIVTAIKSALDREKALARTDALTEVMNARMFAELGAFEIHKARRFERPLSVAFLDVDDFKSVNDQFGHDAGDALLQTVARTIKDHIRAADIIARLGGDEFAIMLPETGAAVAPLVLEKLRAELLEAVKRGGWPVTFSIGVMTFAQSPPTVQEMLRLTDLVMYEVKHSGKNKLKHVVWTGNPPVAAGSSQASHTALLAAPPVLQTGGRRRARQAVASLGSAAARPSSYRAWAPAVVLLAVCLFGAALALNTLVESLPGSSLYPLKRQTENLQLMFAQDVHNSVRFHMALADRRLAETAALLNAAQYELAEATAGEYDSEVDATLSAIEGNPMQVSLDLLQVVAERLLAQQGQLAWLDGQGPPQARTIVEHSLVKSRDASSRLALIASWVVTARLNLSTPTVAAPAGATPVSANGSAPSTAPTSFDAAKLEGTPTPTPAGGGGGDLGREPATASTGPAPNSTPDAGSTVTPTLAPTPVPVDTPPGGQSTNTPAPEVFAVTSTPTATSLPSETPTASPVPNDTSTPTPVPTSTQEPAATPTPTAAALPRPPRRPPHPAAHQRRRATPAIRRPRHQRQAQYRTLLTAIPTPTATTSPTAIPTPTATNVPTAVPTPTATEPPTATPTLTVRDIPTATPTSTTRPEPTPTRTPTLRSPHAHPDAQFKIAHGNREATLADRTRRERARSRRTSSPDPHPGPRRRQKNCRCRRRSSWLFRRYRALIGMSHLNPWRSGHGAERDSPANFTGGNGRAARRRQLARTRVRAGCRDALRSKCLRQRNEGLLTMPNGIADEGSYVFGKTPINRG